MSTTTSAPRPESASGSGLVLSHTEAPTEKGLKSGALGLISNIVIGVASTAPAYSLAATLGLIVAAVGLKSPLVAVLAFIPMLLVSIGYSELNKADPDCGTTFTWGTRTFGPKVGGWADGGSSSPTCSSWRAWPRSRGSTASCSSTPTASAPIPPTGGCCSSAWSSWPP